MATLFEYLWSAYMKSGAESTETRSSGVFLPEIPVCVDPSDTQAWASMSPEHRDQSHSVQTCTFHRFLFTEKHTGLKEWFSAGKEMKI